MSLELWDCDAIQFPRLLAEINACCELNEKDWEALSESTGLELARIAELFDRAGRAWESFKATNIAQSRPPSQVREAGTFTRLLASGQEQEFVLLHEPDANAVFAVEAAFVEREQAVYSPYGNGELVFEPSEGGAAT